MLDAIRNHSKSIVVYALFILLILSFIVWGAGDVITGGSSRHSVATVGDRQIGQAELRDAFNREVNRLRAALGDRFDRRAALAMGFDRSVLASLVNEALFDLGAADLGLAVSEDIVRAEIRKNPAFHDIAGEFDINRFRNALSANGLTEQRYVDLIGRDIRRGIYLDVVKSGATAPKTLVDALYRLDGETRTVAVVAIEDETAAKTLPEPTEKNLKTFHNANANTYTAPEYRGLSYVYLTAADLSAGIDVTPEELREAYAAREASLKIPEQRTIRQILVKNEEKAKEIAAAIGGGKDFLEAATEIAGMNPKSVDLGTVTKDRYLPELADAVFALAEGAVTPPLKSPLGWHLVQVTDIKAGVVKTLDDARDDLTREVRLDKATDALYELSNKFEDGLGGGATLEEAAKTIGLSVKTIAAMDARGFDMAGKKIEGTPVEGDFAGVAFQTPENQESALIESGSDGYFMIRVDGITPSRLKPLDEVRNDVVRDWKAEQRAAAADALAEKILEALKSGGDPKAVAKREGLAIKLVDDVARSGRGNLPQALVNAIFKVDPNESVRARGRNATLVAKVLDIDIPDPSKAPERTAALAETLNDEIERDILGVLAQGIQRNFPVRINQAALEATF